MAPTRLVDEFLVPAEHGRGYIVKAGQVQRIIMVEGPQVADMILFNAHNFKETYDPSTSYIYNSVQKTGTDRNLTYLYSKPPWLNVMFRVTEDRVAVHWVLNGSKCAAKRFELMGLRGYHRNCFDNLVEAIAPHGLGPDDVPDAFNLFMHVGFDEDGRYYFKPPAGKRGDYIDLRAEMDCLVGLSACPAGDVSIINGEGADRGNKPLKVEIREE